MSFVATFAASLGTAIAFLARRGWFGAGDLGAFIFWTVPFSILIAVLGRIVSSRTISFRQTVRYALAIPAGLAGAFGFTLLVAMFLGPWFGAFSFPVFICWLIGGAAGMSCHTVLSQVDGSELNTSTSLGSTKPVEPTGISSSPSDLTTSHATGDSPGGSLRR